MALDRFELLELRRDDGVQTFHAREIATARPVQVHLFPNGDASLLSRLDRLPAAERLRVLDRGVSEGKSYVVTDRLAGFASFREWVDAKAAPSLDQQFFQLFDPPTPEPEPAPLPQPVLEPVKVKRDSLPFAAKAVLAVVLGVAAALAFLALVIAVFAFHLW